MVWKFELFTYTRVKIGFDCLFTYDSIIDLRCKLVMIVVCYACDYLRFVVICTLCLEDFGVALDPFTIDKNKLRAR